MFPPISRKLPPSGNSQTPSSNPCPKAVRTIFSWTLHLHLPRYAGHAWNGIAVAFTARGTAEALLDKREHHRFPHFLIAGTETDSLA